MPERDLQREQEQRVDHAIKKDPTVIFMLEKMEEVHLISSHKCQAILKIELSVIINLPQS